MNSTTTPKSIIQSILPSTPTPEPTPEPETSTGSSIIGFLIFIFLLGFLYNFFMFIGQNSQNPTIKLYYLQVKRIQDYTINYFKTIINRPPFYPMPMPSKAPAPTKEPPLSTLIEKGQGQDQSSNYEADKATNKIQKSSSCYIGQQNNTRSCIDVNQYDKCMSGQIFPTLNKCILGDK